MIYCSIVRELAFPKNVCARRRSIALPLFPNQQVGRIARHGSHRLKDVSKTHLRSLLHRLEREIKEFDRQIKEVRKAALAAITLKEKLAGQKQIKTLESERGKRRRTLFDARDDIDRRRDQLIVEIEGKLQQKVNSQQLFAIRWQVR